MDELEVSVRRPAGEIPIVDLVGTLSIHTSGALQDTLEDLIGGGCRTVLINLSQVPYMDSAGLSVIIHAYRRLHHHQGHLGVIAPKGAVQRVFEITWINRVVKIYTSEEEALSERGV